MRKCFVLLLIILLMAGCNVESNRINETPNSTPISPTPDAENYSNTISPAPDTADNSDIVSPSPGTEDNKSTPIPKPTDIAIPSVTADITTSILIKGLFMGGLSEGQWLQADEFFQSGVVDLEGFSYDVFKDGSNTGTAIGGLPTSWMTGEQILEDQYNWEYCIAELFDNDKQKIDYDIALQADWNLFPRAYQLQNTEQTYYMNLLIDHLKSYGLENPETTIKQIIKVDIEGDGTDEALIAADNTTDDRFEEVNKGDNAVLLFRKLVDGEVINQVLEQDIRVEEEEYPSIYRILSQVELIADLDGDNEMEIIIKSWYYEGAYWSIYKLIDNRLELVASSGYGA